MSDETSETLPFDVHIQFTGMCVYARDEAHPDGARLHVLAPSLPDGCPCAGTTLTVEPHTGVLFTLNPGHLEPGETRGTVGDPVVLDGKVLELLGVGGPDFSLDLSEHHLPNMEEITGVPVPRELVTGLPDRVGFRVTLDRGHATGHGDSLVWMLEDQEREITFRIDWTIDDVKTADGRLHLAFTGRNGSEAGELALRPVPDAVTHAPRIDLVIGHVPPEEVRALAARVAASNVAAQGPGAVGGASLGAESGVAAEVGATPSGHHFGGLYELFPGARRRPIPTFVRDPSAPNRVDPDPVVVGVATAGQPGLAIPTGPVGLDTKECLGATAPVRP